MTILKPTRKQILLGFLVIAAMFLAVTVSLAYLFPQLNQANQALVLASALGALGTFALAFATVVTIFQTNRSLELRESKRQEPLAVDELSYFIEPAIRALDQNLSSLSNPKYGGCAYEWVYVDKSKLKAISKGPAPVQYANTLDLAKFENENPEVYECLRKHDRKILETASCAQEFHSQVSPKVVELLKQEQLEEKTDRDKVLTSAILKELDHFGEQTDLYNFWEKHGDELIRYSNEHPDTTVDDIKALEGELEEICETTLKQTQQWKHMLQEKYGISEQDLHEVEMPPKVI